MLLTVSTEAFYVARGGMGPHADAIVGKFTGEMLVSLGMGTGVADVLHQASWWAHLLIILGFSIYIPFSKHMHMIAAPVNAYLLSLEPKGELETIDLETAEHFGAGRIQDFTWKQLLDGYACAVCGRCTDNCPANISGKTLSPMHIVEDLKDYLLEEGSNTFKGKKAENPLIGFKRITEEALWDCVSCGACMEECPVAVEHVPTIMDMRRHLVLEESKLPETAMNTLLSMEQRGHPWRGTQFSRMKNAARR
jgi:heterodisulfide reductase subunit C